MTGVTYSVDYGYIEGFTGEDGMGLDVSSSAPAICSAASRCERSVSRRRPSSSRVTKAELEQILPAFEPVLLRSRTISEHTFMGEIARFKISG